MGAGGVPVTVCLRFRPPIKAHRKWKRTEKGSDPSRLQAHTHAGVSHFTNLASSIFFFPPQKFQDIEESHVVHMKEIIRLYSQSVNETHVQIGEVSMTADCRHSCGRPVDPPYVAAN